MTAAIHKKQREADTLEGLVKRTKADTVRKKHHTAQRLLKPLAVVTQTRQGYRNRIILEILYDTAIRRAEVSAIKITDIDLDSGYIRINGKGDKDRVVPLSKRVCALVNNYILMIRPA